MPYLPTPSGKYVEVPEGMSDDEAETLARQKFPAFFAKPPTIGGYIKETLKAPIRGFVGSLGQAARGIGALLPEETETAFARGVKAAEEMLSTKAAAGYEEAFPVKLGEALGSMMSFAIPGGVAGVAGRSLGAARAARAGLGATEAAAAATRAGKVGELAAMVPFAGAAGAGEARVRAEEAGATPEQRAMATAAGILPGLTDVLPVEKLLRIAPPEALKTATDYIKRALVTGGMEAGQEAAQNFAQNLIAKGIYKPEQALLEGTGEGALYGGSAGALAQALMDLTLGRRAAGAARVAKEREDAVKQAAARAEAEKTAQEQAFQKEQAERPVVPGAAVQQELFRNEAVGPTFDDPFATLRIQIAGAQNEMQEYQARAQAAQQAGDTVAYAQAVNEYNNAKGKLEEAQAQMADALHKETGAELVTKLKSLQNQHASLNAMAVEARNANDIERYEKITEHQKKLSDAISGLETQLDEKGLLPVNLLGEQARLGRLNKQLEAAQAKASKDSELMPEEQVAKKHLPKIKQLHEDIQKTKANIARAQEGAQPNDMLAGVPTLEGAREERFEREVDELQNLPVPGKALKLRAEKTALLLEGQQDLDEAIKAREQAEQEKQRKAFAKAKYERSVNAYAEMMRDLALKNTPFLDTEGKRGRELYGDMQMEQTVVNGKTIAATAPATYTPKRQTATKKARQVPDKAVLPALRSGFVTKDALSVLGLNLPAREYDVQKPEDARLVLAAANKVRPTLVAEMQKAAVPVTKLLDENGAFTPAGAQAIYAQGRLQELVRLQEKAAATLRSAQESPAIKQVMQAAESKSGPQAPIDTEAAEKTRDTALENWEKNLARLYNGKYIEAQREQLKELDGKIENVLREKGAQSTEFQALKKQREAAQPTLSVSATLEDILASMKAQELAYIQGQLDLANAARQEKEMPPLSAKEQVSLHMRLQNSFAKQRDKAKKQARRAIEGGPFAKLQAHRKRWAKSPTPPGFSNLEAYLNRISYALENPTPEYKVFSPRLQIELAPTDTAESYAARVKGLQEAADKGDKRAQRVLKKLAEKATPVSQREDTLANIENALRTMRFGVRARALLEEAADRLAGPGGTTAHVQGVKPTLEQKQAALIKAAQTLKGTTALTLEAKAGAKSVQQAALRKVMQIEALLLTKQQAAEAKGLKYAPPLTPEETKKLNEAWSAWESARARPELTEAVNEVIDRQRRKLEPDLRRLTDALAVERSVSKEFGGAQPDLFAPTEQEEFAQLSQLQQKGTQGLENVLRGKEGPTAVAILFDEVRSISDAISVITNQLQKRKEKLAPLDAKAKELRTRLHEAESALLKLSVANEMHTPLQKEKAKQKLAGLDKQIAAMETQIAAAYAEMAKASLKSAAKLRRNTAALGQRLADARAKATGMRSMQAEISRAETAVFAARLEYANMLSAYPVQEQMTYDLNNIVRNFTDFLASDRVAKLRSVIAGYKTAVAQAQKKAADNVAALQKEVGERTTELTKAQQAAVQQYYNNMQTSREEELEALKQAAYYAEELRGIVAAKQEEVKALESVQAILDNKIDDKTAPLTEVLKARRLRDTIYNVLQGPFQGRYYWGKVEEAKAELKALEELRDKATQQANAAAVKAQELVEKLAPDAKAFARRQKAVQDAEVALVTAKVQLAQATKKDAANKVKAAEETLVAAKKDAKVAEKTLAAKIGELGQKGLEGVGRVAGTTTVTRKEATDVAERVRDLRTSRAIGALKSQIERLETVGGNVQRLVALRKRLARVEALQEFPHKVKARVKPDASSKAKTAALKRVVDEMLDLRDAALARNDKRRAAELATQIGAKLGITGREKALWASTGFDLRDAVRTALLDVQPLTETTVLRREGPATQDVAKGPSVAKIEAMQRAAPLAYAKALEAGDEANVLWWQDKAEELNLDLSSNYTTAAYKRALELKDKDAIAAWEDLQRRGYVSLNYNKPFSMAASEKDKALEKLARDVAQGVISESKRVVRKPDQKTGVPKAAKGAPSEGRTLTAKERAPEGYKESAFTEVSPWRDFIDDSGNAFRLTKTAVKGVDAAAAQDVADAVKANMPSSIKLTYAPTIADIPANFRQAVERSGKDINNVQGMVLQTGEVLVVGENHGTTAELEETFAHELIGHYSVDTVLGPERFEKLVNDLFSRPGGVRHVAQVAADLGVYDSVLEGEQGMARAGKSEEALRSALVREMIAHAAEGRPVKADAVTRIKDFWRSIVDSFKDALSAMGFGSMAARDAREIQRIIRQAHKAFAADKLGAYRSPTGQVAFQLRSVGDTKYDDIAEALYGKQTSLKDRLTAANAGLEFNTTYVDRLAGFAEISRNTEKGKDALLGSQMMYYMREVDELSKWTGLTASTGRLVIEKTTDPRTGKDFYRYKVMDGANLTQLAKAIGDLPFGNAIKNEERFGMYVSGLRANSVGYEKLGIDGTTQARLKEFMQDMNLPENKAVKQQLDEAAAIYREFRRNLITFAEQTGAIGEEEAKRLRDQEDYIPYYRVMEDGSVLGFVDKELAFRVGDIQTQPHLHQLVGGKQMLFRPFTAALMNTNMLVGMGLKNQAAKNTAAALADLGLVEPFEYKVKDEVTGKKTGEIKEYPIRSGDGKASNNVIRFKVKGEDKHVIVRTEGTAFDYIPAQLLVRGLEGVSTLVPWYVRGLSIPARLLRKMIVLSPAYAANQIMKDPLSSFITTGADAVPVLSALNELKRMVTGGNPEQEELRRVGLLSSEVLTGTTEDAATILRQITAGQRFSLLGKMEALGMKADAANRIALYNSFRQQGLNELEAFVAAKEAFNSNTRGTSPGMYHLSLMIPFFNSGIQSLNVLAKSLTGKMPYNERLKVREKLLVRGVATVGMTLAYAALLADEDWYKEIPEQQKLQYWFFKLPGVKDPLRIPIPFEVGFIFKALPEAVFRAANNDKDAAPAMKALFGAAVNMLPINPIPAGAKPFIETWANRSFFTGEQIETARERELDPAARYRDSTTEFSKMLSAMGAPVSPLQMDNLIRGYLGSLGLELTSMLNPFVTGFAPSPKGEEPEKDFTRMAGIKAFFQPLEARGIIDRAYDFMNEAERRKNTYAKMVDEGRLDEAEAYLKRYEEEIMYGKNAAKFKAAMSKLTKAERAVRMDPGLSGAQKREMLDLLRVDKKETALAYASAAF